MYNRVQSQAWFQDDLSFLVPNDQMQQMPVELQELCEQYNSDCDALQSDNVANSDWPVSLFVPERYEPNYAYPLFIWFHDENSSENELDIVMNAIGDQNYLGLAIRGNKQLAGDDSFGWSEDSPNFGSTSLQDLVNVTTRRLRRAFHIHSERIFAAGCGTGADVALQLFAQRPEWFAGALVIEPECDCPDLKLGSAEDLRGKNILHAISREASNEKLARNLDTVRLMRSAGVEMDVRVTAEPLDPCSNDARFIDTWVLSHLNCETYA